MRIEIQLSPHVKGGVILQYCGQGKRMLPAPFLKLKLPVKPVCEPIISLNGCSIWSIRFCSRIAFRSFFF